MVAEEAGLGLVPVADERLAVLESERSGLEVTEPNAC
jgi:hypothetical protein